MKKLLTPSTVLAASLLAVPTAAMAHGSGGHDDVAVCVPYLGLVAQFSSEEPDPSAVEEHLAAARAASPAAIAEPLGVAFEAIDTALDGDFSVFETPEFAAALAEVDTWAFEHCSFGATYDVVAVDWAFGGIPLEVPAGQVAFRLNNVGTEYHEMAIVRKLDGVTQSWDELAPLIANDVINEDGSTTELVEVVAHAWSPNAETAGIAYADLEPGEYAAMCFVPIGATHDMSDEEVFEEAVPGYDAHWQHGMLQLFTVVAAG